MAVGTTQHVPVDGRKATLHIKLAAMLRTHGSDYIIIKCNVRYTKFHGKIPRDIAKTAFAKEWNDATLSDENTLQSLIIEFERVWLDIFGHCYEDCGPASTMLLGWLNFNGIDSRTVWNSYHMWVVSGDYALDPTWSQFYGEGVVHSSDDPDCQDVLFRKADAEDENTLFCLFYQYSTIYSWVVEMYKMLNRHDEQQVNSLLVKLFSTEIGTMLIDMREWSLPYQKKIKEYSDIDFARTLTLYSLFSSNN